MKTTDQEQRIKVLSDFLECDPDEITESEYQQNLFEHGREEYYVLTDHEADEICRERIYDEVWAFNAWFLADHSDVADEETFKILQEKYESANEAIKRLINDMDAFFNDAISADGRGHFMSGYDGNEIERGEYFIYRQN